MFRRPSLAVCVLAFSLPAFGGKFNPALSIGDAAPVIEALPGIDGERHALAGPKETKVVVLAFTCNTCPYAVDHEDRLNALAKSFKGKSVQLLAINSNSDKTDDLDAMKAHAKEKRFAYPYLKDETGVVGKAFGATRTPEFVVLNEKREVVYLGAMDDDPDG